MVHSQILPLPARNASAWTGPSGNTTYFLRGRVPALIDAGVGDPAHIDEIETALDGARLESLLITHGHVDHVAGIPAIVARWPRVRVLRHPGIGIDAIPAGDAMLRPIHTPGHAPDHVCFFNPETGDLFCGDLIRADGTIVIPASKGGHLGQYLESLRRIRDLNPATLLPAHGPAIDEPARVIDSYLSHRQEREQQIIAALRTGAETPDQIVVRVYERLPQALVSAAADTVLAHLVKLQEEGKTIVSFGVWRLA